MGIWDVSCCRSVFVWWKVLLLFSVTCASVRKMGQATLQCFILQSQTSKCKWKARVFLLFNNVSWYLFLHHIKPLVNCLCLHICLVSGKSCSASQRTLDEMPAHISTIVRSSFFLLVDLMSYLPQCTRKCAVKYIWETMFCSWVEPLRSCVRLGCSKTFLALPWISF